jgi:Na+/melibiose symporter-like transporter
VRGKREQAYAALLRSRSAEQADLELKEMEETALAKASSTRGTQLKDSLLRRKYVIPFVLACVILACNTATGINSVVAYNTDILLQSGLSDLHAHWGYVVFTCMNFLMTIGGMALVDRKGRKFLFILGTSGITVAMICVGLLFLTTEKANVDCKAIVQAMVGADQTLALRSGSFTRMATSQHRPALFALTMRAPLRFKSFATIVCRETRWKHFSKTHSGISTPRRRRP